MGRGDRAAVGRVKELLAGVSHQTALPRSLSLWALRVRGGRRGEVTLCLPPSPPLHPSGLNPCGAKRWRDQREKQRGGRDKVTERGREDEANKNAPQAEDG